MVDGSMDQNRRDDGVDGRVGNEGGRSPSTSSTGQGATAARGGAALGPLAPGPRWSAARKRGGVLRPRRRESAQPLSPALGLPAFKLAHRRRKGQSCPRGGLTE